MQTQSRNTRWGPLARVGALVCLGVWSCGPAAPASEPTGSDLAAQEQVNLLTAKLKKMAEIQDLLVQQHQLVLEHLDALRKDVDRLARDRTNAVSRPELEAAIDRLERLQREAQGTQATNLQRVCALVHELADDAASGKAAAGANAASAAPATLSALPILDARFPNAYRVQPGDTLLKILARANEALEKQNRPRLTQEELERANPGLTPDRIKVGQVILIPIRSSP